MSIDIILDNYRNTCYPGQTLAGRVECYFNKPEDIRGIRIKFRGRAKTEWSESESYYDSTEKKHKTRHVRYMAEEPYFNAEYNLVGGGNSFMIPGGRHSYPFSYIIPQNMPSSFEGSYGNIRYHIKATVDRPWTFDYETRFNLHVTSPLDLNYLPNTKDPVAISLDKDVGCCCCRSGPLTFNVSLPITGYVPGQEVNIGAYVQNMSNVNAECVKFKIVKNLEFITHHPSTRSKYESELVTKCIDGGIGAHGDKSWTATITIPVMDFPNLLACNIISIRYELVAKVVLPCPHTNLSSNIPFSIGTIPISGVNTNVLGPPSTMTYNPVPPLQGNSYSPSQINMYPPGPGASAPPGQPIINPSAPSDDNKHPSVVPPYPGGGPPYPTPNSTASYPSATGGAPYPPSSTIGWPETEPSKNETSATAPPSYEEAEQLIEKNKSKNLL